MNAQFTTIDLPWGPSFPTMLLSIFLSSMVILSLILHKLIVIWFERLFYPDSLAQVFDINNPETHLVRDNEIEISTYKFKVPGIIRRITGTYFAKSKREDMQNIRGKVDKLIKKYTNGFERRSVDLEQMYRDHDFDYYRTQHNKKLGLEETKANVTSHVTNPEQTQEDFVFPTEFQKGKKLKHDKSIHYSMASSSKIK